jgi:hypothetical protein
MSYLGPLRLHFAGGFQAIVSTVNNEPMHFDNATFQPRFQQRGVDGSWNPRGDGDWRLIGCTVRSAWMSDGTAAGADDPVLTMLIADSDRAAPAKLVDLDSQQQGVSTIWGLEMRICAPDGTTLVRGSFEPIGFMDLWLRVNGAGGMGAMGAMFQSVMTGVEWRDVTASPFLSQLRDQYGGSRLSVKFNVDGYQTHFTNPRFTIGRITGSIGPAAPNEPDHLVRGRQFVATVRWDVTEDNQLNTCAAALDPATAKLYLDLGNALQTDTSGGDIVKPGALSLSAGTQSICPVPYDDSAWYERTAGVLALPVDRSLSDAEMELIAKTPLTLALSGKPDVHLPEVSEYVRPDQFVFRLSPGETVTARLYATNLGVPLADATVHNVIDTNVLQNPATGVPPGAIDFPATVATGADGVATLTISGSDPGNPRDYIDGQVYAIRPSLQPPTTPVNDPNFISVLLFDAFEIEQPPTWYPALQPMFQQYANLYPVMQGFLDLSEYDSVVANRELLLLAFGLDISDPNSMPVTRDLSPAKRAAILKFLNNPQQGVRPPPAAAPAPARAAVAPEADREAGPQMPDGTLAALVRIKSGKSEQE